MNFGKIGAALSNLLGIDTTEMTEVEIAAAIEDAASKPETAVVDTNVVVETAEAAETSETAAEEAVNYAELISTLTAKIEAQDTAIENMGNLVTVIANRVAKLGVASVTPTSTTTVVSGVEKLNKQVSEVATSTKEAKGIDLNEFAAVASIK